MNWKEVRKYHPDSWVIIEAIEAYTQNGERVIERMSVHGVYGDEWKPAWEQYKEIHKADKTREYLVIHTGREEMDIGVIDVFGRRAESE